MKEVLDEIISNFDFVEEKDNDKNIFYKPIFDGIGFDEIEYSNKFKKVEKISNEKFYDCNLNKYISLEAFLDKDNKIKKAFLFLGKKNLDEKFCVHLIYYPENPYGKTVMSHNISDYNSNNIYGLYNNRDDIFYIESSKDGFVKKILKLNHSYSDMKTSSFCDNVSIGFMKKKLIVKDDELLIKMKIPILKKEILFNLCGNRIN